MQVALLVPLIAALIGLVLSFGMMKLPDPQPSAAAERMAPARRASRGAAQTSAAPYKIRSTHQLGALSVMFEKFE
jgi:hypothetical protein